MDMLIHGRFDLEKFNKRISLSQKDVSNMKPFKNKYLFFFNIEIALIQSNSNHKFFKNYTGQWNINISEIRKYFPLEKYVEIDNYKKR